MAIHRAVTASNGRDEYTGETLDWSLLSRYNNDESEEKRRHYKASFALLPTVDHIGDRLTAARKALLILFTGSPSHSMRLFMASRNRIQRRTCARNRGGILTEGCRLLVRFLPAGCR
jgi:hypothetical protein